MTRRDAIWGALAAGFLVMETLGMRSEDGSEGTFSDLTRRVMHTDTPVGRGLFLAGWAWMALWFPVHILRPYTGIEPRDVIWPEEKK